MIGNNFSVLEELIMNNPNWRGIDDAEALILYNLALNTEYDIIEIGTNEGFSTICLALGSKDGNNVDIITIDPHTGFATTPIEEKEESKQFTDSAFIGELTPIYDEQLLGTGISYSQYLEHIKEYKVDDIIATTINYSELAFSEVKDTKVDLLFIDGDHRYHFVEKDFELYSSLVANTGSIILDDRKMVGPATLIKDLKESNKFYLMSLTKSFMQVKKKEEK